ncbi:major facilitator superfamily transporter protein [Rutstroemia sp. NJR-2017a BVV2]|nr:major facilitator superfamily transporter protein [Rutstroemia sp. NJR-2017a BVV2]
MDFYDSAFLVLISACGILTWQRYRMKGDSAEDKKNADVATPLAKAEASRFTKLFLTVYCLVMASDWLQGPYIYSLYHDQFGLDEKTVALLFTTGFLSGGISGYFVGSFADKYGRKSACLVFCLTYMLSCFSTLSPVTPVLFLGRVFGGLSTSLMYSAFESWMVTEYHKRKIHQAGTSLSTMFGIMTTLNSVMAILSGVFSEWLVQVTDDRRMPFMASAALLCVSAYVITLYWTENYGDSATQQKTTTPTQTPSSQPSSRSSSPTPVSRAPAANPSILNLVLTNSRIFTLGLASCFFEGSMYLFVFFWTPALKSTQSPAAPSLPLGMIFASFMASVMLGSLLFTHLSPLLATKLPPSRLLTIIFSTASITLLIPLLTKSEPLTFLAFCVFEGMVGMYFPSIGYLKGKVVEDGVRARVYGVLRIPLNIFVVVSLALVKEGEAYRRGVFLACGGLLVAVSGIFHRFVKE